MVFTSRPQFSQLVIHLAHSRSEGIPVKCQADFKMPRERIVKILPDLVSNLQTRSDAKITEYEDKIKVRCIAITILMHVDCGCMYNLYITSSKCWHALFCKLATGTVRILPVLSSACRPGLMQRSTIMRTRSR